MRVRPIETDALANDRDQLFAEAVHLYRAGERWWPDCAFEEQHIRPEQDARYGTDAWEKAVAEWLPRWEHDTDPEKNPVTIPAIARRALWIDTLIEPAWAVLNCAGRRAGVLPRGKHPPFQLQPRRLNKHGTADQQRIAAALERLGWVRGERTAHGRPWVPGPGAAKAGDHG